MIITKVQDVRGDNINWVGLGMRLKNFREERNLTLDEAAQETDVSHDKLRSIEGAQKENRQATNFIWKICAKWNLSLNWFLNGIGKPHDADPVDLIPETLIIQRGVGIRREEREEAETGNYSDDAFEFAMAVSKFQVVNGVLFPSLTQIFEIVQALGYRKTAPARICPMKHNIKDQQLAEKSKVKNEKEEFSQQVPGMSQEWRKRFYPEKRMCVYHDPDFMHILKKDKKNKKSFIAYIMAYHVDNGNTQLNYKWTVGIHKVAVQKIGIDGCATTGICIYLDRAETLGLAGSMKKVIAVRVDPKDMIYGNMRIVVCQKIEIKSMSAVFDSRREAV